MAFEKVTAQQFSGSELNCALFSEVRLTLKTSVKSRLDVKLITMPWAFKTAHLAA